MTCAKPSHAQPLAPFTVGELLSSDTLVSGVDACLRYLCAWWRDRTSATTVAIAVSDAHRDCDVVAVARETGDVEVWRQSRCQLASPALASRVSRLVSGACETAAIPLNSDGVTAAGCGSNRRWRFWTTAIAGARPILSKSLPACWPPLYSESDAWHEKLESIAEFAAGAGHEINNPLGTILGRGTGNCSPTKPTRSESAC
ncbi:MAG: hypothetical protein R3B90_03505 [Planctomycetaceae bacterium]